MLTITTFAANAAQMTAVEQADLAVALTAQAQQAAITELAVAVHQHAPQAGEVRLDWVGHDEQSAHISLISEMNFKEMCDAVELLNALLGARTLALIMQSVGTSEEFDGVYVALSPTPTVRRGTVYQD